MQKRKVLVAGVLALSLAVMGACGTSSSSSSSKSTQESSQESTPTVINSKDGLPTVSFDDSGVPSLDFGSLKAPKDIQAGILEEGDGAEITSSDYLVVDYLGFVWGKDTPFDSSFQRGAPAGFWLGQLVKGWTYGLEGKHVGDSLLLSIPPAYGYGEEGNSSAGIGGEDTIVFYIKIHQSYSTNAAGQKDAQEKISAADLPVEITGNLGEPVTDVQVKKDAHVPGETKTEVIAEGTGEKLAKGSTAILAYAATSWDGSQQENSWTGKPSQDLQGPQSIMIGAGSVFDSLEGVPVGSRVLVTVVGQGSDGSSAVTVAVVDVLGMIPAAQSSEQK